MEQAWKRSILLLLVFERNPRNPHSNNPNRKCVGAVRTICTTDGFAKVRRKSPEECDLLVIVCGMGYEMNSLLPKQHCAQHEWEPS